ncbi:DUF6328 family protein [Nocardioides sp. SR21]|uniref:DUF6328 family protein n=1 Tax=Nocardioides sp. SR21 TaxID=2919501 RepID=UPI001FAB088A|nr:DUF6328 family protein [Nocardioides sp. SR21]
MGDDRDESDEERLDRKFQDMLQELRVMQTGAQLTAGFLLTLPFQEPFEDLDQFQRGVYLALVLGAGLTTALLLTPVAIHRKLTGTHVKERVVRSTHRLMAAALTTLATIIVGIIFFTFDVVIDRTAAFVVAGAMGLVVASLMLALPYSLAGGESSDPD